MDFSLVREGENTPIASSNHSYLYTRSVNLEAKLEEGTYLVYVRLDRNLTKYRVSRTFSCVCLYSDELQGTEEEVVDDDELRKLSKIMTERAISKSVVASGFPFLNLLSISN